MSIYDVALALFVLAIVLALVTDHRRGWLTGLLVDNLRAFHSPRLHASERSDESHDSQDS